MYMDEELLLSDKQAATLAQGTHDSEDTIDKVKAGDAHTPLKLVIGVTVPFTSGGAATVLFKLVTDDDSGFGSPNTLITTKAFSLAELVAGAQLFIGHLPSRLLQHTKLQYVVGTADLTAGTFNAFLVKDAQTNKVPNV